MAQTEDQIMSAGEPYFRVVQPKSPTVKFDESSYLRLGSYVATNDEEKTLVTGLTTTTSTVTKEDKKAIDQAQDAIDNKKGDPAKDFNQTSQATETYTTKASDPIVSANNGVLIYTDGDLHENVVGAVLQKHGKGNVIEVTTADAKLNVKAGKYDLSAANGIFVKAGTFDANGKVVAGANIELTAGGYIKQVAFGDLDEVTWGITHKRFHGIANDMFMGLKFSFFFGVETSVKLSGMLTIIMSAEASFRLSTRFSLTMSADASFAFATTANFFMGYKFDFLLGGEKKIINGWSAKIGPYTDLKKAISDMKILDTFDVKTAVGDLKKVTNNITVCEYDIKVEIAAIKKGDMEADRKTLVAELADIVTEKGFAKFNIKDLTLYG